MSTSASPIDVDLSQAGPLGNEILQQLNAVREQDGVHWSEASQCWLITRHEELVRALNDEFPLSLDRLIHVTLPSVPVDERVQRYPLMMRYMQNWIINLDPPAHTRVRKLVMSAFNRKVVENLRPFVKDRVATLIDKLESEGTIEFNEEIARPLPGSVILKMLGLPPENLSRLRDWANAFVEAVAVPGVSDAALQRFEDALADMNGLLTTELEKRRHEPQDDLLTAMVKANEAGDTLSLDEMLGALHVLVVAGHDTTASSMTMGLATMIAHPESWDYMYTHPEKIMDCVLELARHMAMATSQPRFVLRDFEWNGHQIKQGQVVFLMLAAGNRDPRVFPDPEKLDFERRNDRSLTFAPGAHHCIGHLVAKLQLTEFFAELVRRFEGAELLDPKLDFMPQIAFRGLYQLNVRMKPRRAD